MPDKNNSSILTNTVTRTVSTIPEFVPDRDDWFEWKERFELYFDEIDCETEKQKVAALLKAIGGTGYSKVRNLCNPKLPIDVEYKKLCDLLEGQFAIPLNIYRERDNFYSAENWMERQYRRGLSGSKNSQPAANLVHNWISV